MIQTAQYLSLASLHQQLSELLGKTVLEMMYFTRRTEALTDCIIYCLNDLERAMAARDGSYPAFSSAEMRSVQTHQANKLWFDRRSSGL